MTAGDFGWKVGNRIRVLEARKFDSFMAKWAESECSEAGPGSSMGCQSLKSVDENAGNKAKPQ